MSEETKQDVVLSISDSRIGAKIFKMLKDSGVDRVTAMQSTLDVMSKVTESKASKLSPESQTSKSNE